jgi:AcrR family transcriptional regulator
MTLPQKKQVLLDAAIELFAQDGFWNTTTANIAKHAGVGTGTLFTYFPSKNDLMDEVYLSIKSELLAAINVSSLESGSVREVLEMTCSRIMQWGCLHPAKLRLLHQLRQSNLISQRVRDAIEEDWRPLLQHVQKGQQAGILAPQDLSFLQQFIVSYIETLQQHLLQHQLTSSAVEDLVTSTFPMLWRAITPPLSHEKDPT